MADSTYLGLGFLALLAAAAVHYGGWRTLLSPELSSADPLRRRAALLRWGKFAAAWQVVVLILCATWVALFNSHHARGLWWAAPPVGLLLGTALPLQLVVLAIARSGR